MRLRITSCLFLIGLLITACGGASKPTIETISTADVDQQIPSVNTSTPALLVPGDLQLTTNCTVVSSKPTPGPTQESLFPPVSEDDWVKGADEAEVTIIEYSDFQ
jgi:hypothetical protein